MAIAKTRTQLPIDDRGNAIQVLRPRLGGSQNVAAVTSSSTAIGTLIQTGTDVLTLWATDNVFYQTGTSNTDVDSSGHYLPQFERVQISLGLSYGNINEAHNNVSFLAESSACTVYVSELE